MARKLLLLMSGTGALLTTVLWLAQLRGPIVIADGPAFRDARWVLDSQQGWGMYDPTGTEPVYSRTDGGPWYAIEVPSSEAPPMLPAVPDKSVLIGVGFGGLHLGQAYFYDVPKAAFGRNQRGPTDRDRNLLFSCELHAAIKKMRANRIKVSG